MFFDVILLHILLLFFKIGNCRQNQVDILKKIEDNDASLFYLLNPKNLQGVTSDYIEENDISYSEEGGKNINTILSTGTYLEAIEHPRVETQSSPFMTAMIKRTVVRVARSKKRIKKQNITEEENESISSNTIKPSVRKCCRKGEIYKEPLCISINDSYISVKEWIPYFHINIIYGIEDPNNFCPTEKGVFREHSHELFELQSSGLIYLYKENQFYSYELACVDYSLNKNNETKEISFICVAPSNHQSELEKILAWLLIVGLSLSALSMLFIFLLQSLNSTKEKTLQTKCILTSCAALFVYFFLNVMLRIPKTVEVLSRIYTVCLLNGLLLQYSQLCFYFWLNITFYEICRVIRGTTKLIQLQELEGGLKQYLKYCLFSFGCPFLISIATITMQFLPELSEEVERNIVRPGIANGRCYFQKNTMAEHLYLFMMEAVSLLVNCLLVLYTIFLIKKETFVEFFSSLCGKQANQNKIIRMTSHAKKDYLDMFWHQFYTFILFLAIWVINSVSLIHRGWIGWKFVNLLVSLQGVFFMIIVIKAKNWLLWKNFYNIVSKAAAPLSNFKRNSYSWDLKSSTTGTTDTNSLQH